MILLDQVWKARDWESQISVWLESSRGPENGSLLVRSLEKGFLKDCVGVRSEKRINKGLPGSRTGCTNPLRLRVIWCVQKPKNTREFLKSLKW